MNWLAHVYLSPPCPAFRIGNLLPDFLRPPQLAELDASFQPGIQTHRRIDAFTDSHPIVQRSKERIRPPYRRFAPVLIDIFYDHFLAANWQQYSDTPLPQFATEFYNSCEGLRAKLPGELEFVLERMRQQNWFCAYQTVEGIAETLDRMGRNRFRRRVELSPAAEELRHSYDALFEDFQAFFPEMSGHLRQAALLPDSYFSA